MKLLRTSIVAFGVIGSLAGGTLIGASNASAASDLAKPSTVKIAKGKCDPGRVVYRATGDAIATSSASFAQIKGTKVKVNQASNKPKCVIVTFSGTPVATDGRGLRLTAQIDGVVCEPGDVQFGAGTNDQLNADVTSYTFICEDVAPGRRKVNMQWRRSGTDGSVILNNYAMVVRHY